MTSTQTFQGQQSMMAGNSGPPSMVTSTVQQGSSQSSVNNQQFANGQAQMYQTGMMMQPQTNMIGGQPPQQMNQFSSGNSQMQQMMQGPQQTQQMQGQMHPNFNSQANHQQYMGSAQQQQTRIMQSAPGPQQMQQQQQPNQQMTAVSSNSQNPQQQFMMSMSNGPRGSTPQFANQTQMMMQQQPQTQMHQQNSVEVQQQMHANQLMQQAAAYQQQQNQIANASNVQPQQIPSTQSQMIVDEIKPSIQEMSENDASSLQNNVLRHPNLNGPTPPPPPKEETRAVQDFPSTDIAASQDLNGQSANNAAMADRLNQLVKERQTPPTSEPNLTTQNPSNSVNASSLMEKQPVDVKQETTSVQDGANSLMSTI